MKSPKYKRGLEPYETNRYTQLVFLYDNLYGKPYKGEIINERSKETLMDVACSKQRYEGVYKYYQEKQEEKWKDEERKKEKNRVSRYWLYVICKGLHGRVSVGVTYDEKIETKTQFLAILEHVKKELTLENKELPDLVIENILTFKNI